MIVKLYRLHDFSELFFQVSKGVISRLQYVYLIWILSKFIVSSSFST